MWYAKHTPERATLAETISGGAFKAEAIPAAEEETPAEAYDLWKLTRTDSIPNHYKLNPQHDNKVIARTVRNHLRKRFPMCRFSVTSSASSVKTEIKSSPFAYGSDELEAIIDYAYAYVQSYNYNSSDSMTDYFDVNFYGSYRSSICDKWNYEQQGEPDAEMAKSFRENKAAWEQEEKERRERRLQEAEERRRKEAEEAKEIERRQAANRERIEKNAKIVEVDYFLVDCLDNHESKCSNVSRYFEYDEETSRTVAKISREVHLNAEDYDILSKQLIDGFTFFAGKGGSATDYRRLNSMTDYYHMSDAVRKTVEWYSDDCIAVFCDDELKFIVNPEGYSYARYVYTTDAQTKKAEKYNSYLGITEEEAAENAVLASELDKVDAQIIAAAPNIEKDAYISIALAWIKEHDFKMSAKAVRALTDEECKVRMYGVLEKYDSAFEQLRRAGIKAGQKITVITSGVFGVAAMCAVFNDANFSQLTVRKELRTWTMSLKDTLLVYDGALTVLEEVLHKISVRNGIETKRSKFSAYDTEAFEAVLDYFESKGVLPLVNTYDERRA